MLIEKLNIDSGTTIHDILKLDYRAADVFHQFGIDISVSEKLSLLQISEMKGIDVYKIIAELEAVTKDYFFSSSTDYQNWNLDFLVEFIVNIHHQYLKKNLPIIKNHIHNLVNRNENKYSYLKEIEDIILKLSRDVFPHMKQEEEIYFPYVKQIFHAYQSKETYARLFVRTLRKPIENIMLAEHKDVEKKIQRLRDLTDDYNPPKEASTLHRIVFSKLKELDLDLMKHIYLENTFLFPVAITMERELLKQ